MARSGSRNWQPISAPRRRRSARTCGRWRTRGELSRFHGGASLKAGLEYLAYDLRRAIAAPAKEAIARAAIALLPPGASVFINAGTTTEAAARAMQDCPRLNVIADNVNIANITRKYSGISTIVAGGEVRSADGAVAGAAAVNFLDQFSADYALIGGGGDIGWRRPSGL